MSNTDQKTILKFGQPYGSIIQEAYIVPDIKEAILKFSKTLHIGPFYLFEHFPLINARYRGEACTADVTLAIGYSGNMSYELIQQHNDAPSPWRETFLKQGWGYHHRAIACQDFEQDLKYYQQAGYEVAFTSQVSLGTEAAYIDTCRDNYGMIELIEMKPVVEDFFNLIKSGSLGWDGKDPIRTLG